MGRQYERLNIYDFGQHLLDSEDLDPVYVALVHCRETQWEDDQLFRWLVAYWCWYNCGVASYMSELEGSDFWRAMMKAAKNEKPAPHGGRWGRGHERRHARGAQGIKMVEELRKRYGKKPQDMIEVICTETEDKRTCESIMRQVKGHYLFGPWIGFKVADMVDRVLRLHVDFTEAAVFMFKDPVRAAERLWAETHNLPSSKVTLSAEGLHDVVVHLTDHFKKQNAPPFYDRRIGLQEVETILCKWKSHMNGHYPKYNDIDEIGTALRLWEPHAGAAVDFMEHMPAREDEHV